MQPKHNYLYRPHNLKLYKKNGNDHELMHTYTNDHTHTRTHIHILPRILGEKERKNTSQNNIIWTDFIHRFWRTMSYVYVRSLFIPLLCVWFKLCVDGQTVTVCVWFIRMYETRCDSFLKNEWKRNFVAHLSCKIRYKLCTFVNSTTASSSSLAHTHTQTPLKRHTTVAF